MTKRDAEYGKLLYQNACFKNEWLDSNSNLPICSRCLLRAGLMDLFEGPGRSLMTTMHEYCPYVGDWNESAQPRSMNVLKLPSLIAAWLFWTFRTKSHNMKALVIHWWSPFLPLTCSYGKKKNCCGLCVAFCSIFLSCLKSGLLRALK